MTKVPIWRAPRVSYCAQGRVWVKIAQSECCTVNLSESGLLAVIPVQCPPGTAIRVDLPLPGYSRPMPIPAVVVRETEVDGDYAVGIKFDKLLPGSLEVLRSFIQAERAANRSSDSVPVVHVTGTRSSIDLNEVDARLPADLAGDEAFEQSALADGTVEQPLLDEQLEQLDEFGQRRPGTAVRRVKRRVLERLRRKAAAAEPQPLEEPSPFDRVPRVPRSSGVPTAEISEVPEWVDGPREIYDEEERGLINKSEQDERLGQLYRAALSDVDQAEQDREQELGVRKKKGWF